MFDFTQESSVLEFKCSPFTFKCLCQLWEKSHAKLENRDKLFLTDKDLTSRKNKYLRLILSDNLCALLIASFSHDFYQIQITFNPTFINNFLTNRISELDHNSKLKTKLPIQTNPIYQYTIDFITELINTIKWESLQPCPPQQEDTLFLHRLADVLDPLREYCQADRLFVSQIAGNVKDRTINNHIIYEGLNSHLQIEPLSPLKEQLTLVDIPQQINFYRQGEISIVNDINQPQFSLDWQQLMQTLGVKRVIIAPIMIETQLWGLLVAHQVSHHDEWNDHQMQLLEVGVKATANLIGQSQNNQLLHQVNGDLKHQISGQNQEIQNILSAAHVARESKNNFLETMSHELRTPLTCVIGLSSTLLHWSLDRDNPFISIDKQRKYLKSIHDNGRHLLDLINNILDFSEMESGRLVLNINAFPIKETLNHIHQTFEEEIKRHELKFSLNFYFPDNGDSFQGDRARIEQILYQLIDNAIKFTPVGGEVQVRAIKKKGILVFEVQDTGIGIAEEQLPLLFEKFRQLEKSRQRTYGGTGLGLALTKYLVELHDGKIEIESEAGNGSLFRVILPDRLSSVDRFKVPKFERYHRSPTIHQPTPENTIVLIAQDEESSTLICQLLTASNYQVIWLVDDLISVDNVQFLQPWLLIIDQRLPNFPSLIDNLKGLLNINALKLLLLGNESKYLADDFMGYPIKPRKLVDKVNNLFANSQKNFF